MPIEQIKSPNSEKEQLIRETLVRVTRSTRVELALNVDHCSMWKKKANTYFPQLRKSLQDNELQCIEDRGTRNSDTRNRGFVTTLWIHIDVSIRVDLRIIHLRGESSFPLYSVASTKFTTNRSRTRTYGARCLESGYSYLGCWYLMLGHA